MDKNRFIITAEQRLKEKNLDFKVFNFPIAIFSFFKSMADVSAWEKTASRFNAVRINHPQSDDSRLHWGKVLQWPMSVWNTERSGIPIIFVGPVLSGPWTAMALEELKVLGLKYAIGIGAYGSFSERLGINDLVLAEKAMISDGTSREYSDELYSEPSSNLFDLTERVLCEKGAPIAASCVWTIDAMYRETPEKIKRWAETGAECVNMDVRKI